MGKTKHSEFDDPALQAAYEVIKAAERICKKNGVGIVFAYEPDLRVVQEKGEEKPGRVCLAAAEHTVTIKIQPNGIELVEG